MNGPVGKVRTLVRRGIVRPMVEFIQSQASGGVILLVCTLAALFWANSGAGASYHHLWETEIALHFGSAALSLSFHEWINDGFMAVFFLLVGLEIKREILVGELSSIKSASLPILAAVGGMAVPATIYFAFNAGTPEATGWAVPMATDIAFSLGILALLGSRAPIGLKVFLAALAIVDDLGAVVVIALFYAQNINVDALIVSGGLVLALLALNFLKVRSLIPYITVGVALWLSMLSSGVHATIAGVLLALTIPTRVKLDPRAFLERGRDLLDRFERVGKETGEEVILSEDQQSALHAVEKTCEEVQMPLQRLEHMLHSPVNYVIMPVFALANAGVVLSGVTSDVFFDRVTLGVALGLLFGKAIGITLFAWIGTKLRIAALPRSVTWSQIVGVAFLGGIGFTMSLFISSLAFGESSSATLSKLGILVGSAVSGVIGVLLLMRHSGAREPGEGANGG